MKMDLQLDDYVLLGVASYCGSTRRVAVSWNPSAHRRSSRETRQWKSVREGQTIQLSLPQSGVN